jgi:hypothetical protein
MSALEIEQRLRQSESIINRYAIRHQTMDIGIGLAGLLPIPGAATAAMIGVIGAQAPVIYQPMVRELANLYLVDPDASTSTIINQNVLAGAVAATAAEFGIEFLKETATELFQEQGIGLGLSFIPIIGGIAGAALDAIIAKKLTKIVGAMTLVYLEHRAAWVQSRAQTRALVKAAIQMAPNASLQEIVLSVLHAHAPDILRGRRNPRKTSFIHDGMSGTAIVADATFASEEVAAASTGVSYDVLEALAYWRGVDPGSLSALDDVLTGVADNVGLLSATKGHVGEVIAQRELPGAMLAPTSTEPGWDLVWNGSEYQIKVGGSALQQANEALEKHPQFEIISDTKTAASLNSDGHDAIGLRDLADSHVTGITEQTAISIGELVNYAPHLPILSTLLVSYRELRSVVGGETALSEAIANVTTHSGSRSLAIFFTSTVAIGVAAGAHTLPIAGPFITGAAITGGLAGKNIAEKLCAIRVPGRIAGWIVGSMQGATPSSTMLPARHPTPSG